MCLYIYPTLSESNAALHSDGTPWSPATVPEIVVDHFVCVLHPNETQVHTTNVHGSTLRRIVIPNIKSAINLPSNELTLANKQGLCISYFVFQMELLTYFGTPGENHEVVTEDGYILTMHRLQPRSSNSKPPVLMQHGLMGVSEAWILMGPRSDLGKSHSKRIVGKTLGLLN